MKGNITFTMIKPNAVDQGFIGAILAKISEAGFRLSAIKLLKLSREHAMAFYKVHQEKSFYEDLVDFMSSGPIVAAVLKKENAIEDYRKLIGATNPKEAESGTVRSLYGTDIQANGVHGSDSDENALIESEFFFSKMEMF